MKSFINKCQGGVSAHLLAVFLVICFILPLSFGLIQRQAVLNAIGKAKDCINMNAHSAYMALMPEYYTEKQIRLDDGKFQQSFTQLLSRNLELIFDKVNLKEIEVYNHLNEPGVHVEVEIALPRPIFSLLMPAESKKNMIIEVHSDVIFSVMKQEGEEN